jgi:hypothetical protein
LRSRIPRGFPGRTTRTSGTPPLSIRFLLLQKNMMLFSFQKKKENMNDAFLRGK